jgi:4-amino-4-deoxy-L-arabinose transferase-like glycosyltransferase
MTYGMRRAAIWIGILVLYAMIRVPLLPVPLERDEGAFARVGEAILRGEVPYRDIVDHKPPGVFYIYATALRCVPHTASGLHAFLLFWNLATLLCLAALAGALGGSTAARWSGLLYAITSSAPAAEGFAASSEMLLLLPVIASICLAVAAPRTRRGRLVLLLLSGALAAAACWIKPPAAVLLLIVPAWVVLGARREARRAPGRTVWPDLAVWLGAGLALSLALLAYFSRAASWSEFWYWVVTHNRFYTAQAVDDPLGRVTAGLAFMLPDVGVGLLATLLGTLVAVRTGQRHAWLGIGFLLLCLVAVFHSPFVYLHYFALLVPGVALGGGLGLAAIQEATGARWGRRAERLLVAVTIAAMLGVPVAVRPWYWLRPDPIQVSMQTLGVQGSDAAQMLAAYLRERTAADERIFVYGSEPEIPFLAGRRDVNPFATVYPLTGPWPRQREFQERVWRILERDPPTYIVLSRLSSSLVRSASVDSYFEEQLTALGARAYHFETFVIATPAGPRIDANADPRAAAVVFEVWRRTPGLR